MSDGTPDELSGGCAGHRAQKRFGPPWAIWTCLIVGMICAVSGCGVGGSGGAGGSSSQITFTSDRSVILPAPGSSYQLVASGPGSIAWSTSDPQAVSVSPTGLVKALTQTGSATITATAPGASPVTASVIVAAPGPHTVLVDSGDVKLIQGSQVTLAVKPSTSAIKVGDIVVSGDKAGLMGTVQSVSSTAQAVTLQIAPASLPQAFSDLTIHLFGAPVTFNLQVTRGRAAIVGPGGRALAISRGPGFSCKDSSGASVNATLSGPSFSAPIQAQLEATLDSKAFSVQDFSLLVKVTIPAKIDTGTVSFVASGQTSFTCSAELPDLSLPGIPVGPVRIAATTSPSADIEVSANANANLTLAGPSVSDTFTADDGISWTSAGGWQSVLNNSSTGLTFAPPGFKFTAQVQGKVAPSIRLDTGISAETPLFTVAGASLVFDKMKFELGFNMGLPLSYTSPGYTGPTWTLDGELTSGPELKLTGGVADLLKYFGLPTSTPDWPLYDNKKTFAQSPTPKIVASSPTVTVGSSDNLTATGATGYVGSNVEFWAFPSTGAGIRLGTATVNDAGAAVFPWSPTAAQNGTYNIEAFVFGDTFGSLGFPYPSNQAAVKVGGGNVNVIVH